MKKKFLLFLFCLFTVLHTHAQTKVIKSVSNGISTSLHSIIQDGSLVGYLTFTELEKASKDSFNYAITILDENLNDIGKMTFREQKLDLRDVAFDEDLLCLAYIKSDVLGNTPHHKISYKRAAKKGYVAFFAQFINLQGEIVKTFEKKADVDIYHALKQLENGIRPLKQDIQLKNIPGKGFACFYGDRTKRPLLTFSTTGEKVMERQVKEKASSYYLHIAGEDIYLLTHKADDEFQTGYTLFGYSGTTNSPTLKLPLRDKKKNAMDILGFGNDPATGRLFISGVVGKSPNWSNNMNRTYDISRGAYKGVYKIDISSAQKGGVNTVYNYWADSAKKTISTEGLFKRANAHIVPRPSFRDYSGNTYFLGSQLAAKKRKVGIIAAMITLPLISPPGILFATGALGYSKINGAMLIQMDTTGNLSYLDRLPMIPSRKTVSPWSNFKDMDNCSFYSLNNPETRVPYLIIKTEKDIVIYNVQDKKVVRKIAKKLGNVTTSIYPAKDGHIIISEYDEKKQSTKLSIEAV
ncbi:DUF6770 family protein [Chitinophaga rhizophila]|uniref:Uncharacterized protein n=1 Tax=Chitinophaga rhizophila TaxID=2866212 RepID=A0ABS7GEL3_9BACT|nr:DUF6770 family protein [Chitinophaga rhizophila]MBW8685112.1 hypothetical protein [Chitinophaga rhizophila]